MLEVLEEFVGVISSWKSGVFSEFQVNIDIIM